MGPPTHLLNLGANVKNLALDKYLDNIDQLKWLLLVVVACALMIYGLAMKKRAMRAFASSNLLGFLSPHASRPRQYFKAVLMVLAMSAIVLALIGPRWGTYFEQVQQRQLDLMICLDVSRSMLAEDAGMSRLDRAKDDINRLLDRLAGASIGLVTFSGKAELTCPLTDDYEFYRLALSDVGIYSAPVGGTNLGDAIAAARRAFGGEKLHDRVIILLTDGEDQGGTAVDEAAKAHKAGIIVYTIGIGDAKHGALVPVMKNGRRTFLKHDNQQVWSKMDPVRLQAIARAGGGEYHPSGQVTATQRTLEWIYTEKIAPLQRQAQSQRFVERRHVRFHWFAAAALTLLMLEILISERRSKTALETTIGSNTEGGHG